MEVKNKKMYISLFVIIIVGLIVLLIKYFSPYYIVENRVNDIKKYKGVKNDKAIGWVRVQGTNIDYPIVYYDDADVSDPTYDLSWSFTNDGKLTNKVTIFSHNILNVSSNPIIADKSHKRFEQLLSFIYPSFAEKNKYIQYTVGGKNYLYKIYAIHFQKEDTIEYEKSTLSGKEKNLYINKALNSSFFKFDTDINNGDDLLTLVTCTRFFGNAEYSFVVDARRVRKKEKIKNYGITEKKSYNRIKKVMEGEEDNEESL